jgi:pilus assembly protein CpaF
MPILDRLKQPQDDEQLRRADPRAVRGRVGGRIYTMNALRERIEAQFNAETVGRADILAEADTEAKRRTLLLDCANYVLALEAVHVTREEKSELLDQAYANLFGFGPLELYLDDESITEITIDGPDNIHARHGFGKMKPLPAFFDDAAHLRGTIDRVLAAHGAQLVDWNYCLEVGVELHGRPARLGLIAPPVSPHLQLELRLHPPTPFTLDDLIGTGMLTDQAARAITTHIAGGQGLLVVGDAGAGKTTLLGALGASLQGRVVAVQRAAELRLPESVEVRAAIPPTDEAPGVDFEGQIEQVLSDAETPPDWLILDEVRDDDANGAWAALSAGEGGPRCAWAFRGAPDAGRVRSALDMLLRRAQPAIEQAEIDLLLAERLPLVVYLAVRDEQSRVVGVGEFALTAKGELELRPSFEIGEGGTLTLVDTP